MGNITAMKNKFEQEIYFTPKQAAEHVNLSFSTIKNYIYAGKLRTLRTPGGHHRIRRSELLSILGEIPIDNSNMHNALLIDTLCISILGVFKTFGPAGESCILHAQEVSRLASEIARDMNMSVSDIKRIEMAGLLHDIGDIGIDKYIVFKQGKLNSQEYELIKRHPELGAKMLSSIKELKDIAVVVAQHHERVDGRGYPKGLDRRNIQKGARIISIAEAYDSMISSHFYKIPVSKEIALNEIIQKRGSQFDSDIVEHFARVVNNGFHL